MREIRLPKAMVHTNTTYFACQSTNESLLCVQTGTKDNMFVVVVVVLFCFVCFVLCLFCVFQSSYDTYATF